MKKICFINQPSGLGDILLSIKISTHFASVGFKVIHPIFEVYKNIQEYLIIDENIHFVSIEEEFEGKEIFLRLANSEISEIFDCNSCLYVPLKKSFFSNKNDIFNSKSHDYKNMIGKFTMCSLESDNWQDFFEIKRNKDEEEELFKFLEIKDCFHLVNKEFGTPPIWREILNKNIETPKQLQRIDMKIINGFSPFAWLKIFETASIIDTVSTSNFYLLEKIRTKCIPTIYSRNHPNRSYNENFDWMEKLARKKYNFVS